MEVTVIMMSIPVSEATAVTEATAMRKAALEAAKEEVAAKLAAGTKT